MNTVEEYIHKLNTKSHILSKEEFEKNTALKSKIDKCSIISSVQSIPIKHCTERRG